MKRKKTERGVRLRGDERRQVILDVAEELFAEFGYGRTTTARIAREAGVTEPVLYQHFESKLALFQVLLSEISGDTMRELEAMTRSILDPREKMMAIASSFPMVGRKFEKHYRVMLAAMAELQDPETRKILKTHFESYGKFVSSLLERIDGFLDSGLDPTTSAFLLLHTAVGFALMEPLEIRNARGEKYMKNSLRFIGKSLDRHP